jgi:AraC-like DNA-binding protein
MIMLYTSAREHIPKLRALLPSGTPVATTDDWSAFEQTVATSSCAVIVVEWLFRDPVFPAVSKFKLRRPAHPTVLVTRWEPENARLLKDLVVEEVVWFRELDLQLGPAVQRVCTAHFSHTRSLGVVFEEAGQLPPKLREALALACRADPPIRSVNQLALITGCDRRRLWEQWSASLEASFSMRLQDFLHWLVLIRALGRKAPGRSWERVAAEVGVSHRTLRRMAQQLTARTLQQLEQQSPGAAAAEFRGRVVDPLLGAGGEDKLA